MFEELKLTGAERRVKGGDWQEKKPDTQAGDISGSVFVRKGKALNFYPKSHRESGNDVIRSVLKDRSGLTAESECASPGQRTRAV